MPTDHLSHLGNYTGARSHDYCIYLLDLLDLKREIICKNRLKFVTRTKCNIYTLSIYRIKEHIIELGPNSRNRGIRWIWSPHYLKMRPNSRNSGFRVTLNTLIPQSPLFPEFYWVLFFWVHILFYCACFSGFTCCSIVFVLLGSPTVLL